jgi:hypothetical protein
MDELWATCKHSRVQVMNAFLLRPGVVCWVVETDEGDELPKSETEDGGDKGGEGAEGSGKCQGGVAVGGVVGKGMG